MVMHHDHDHVVGVTFGLFPIVREYVLGRKKNKRFREETLDASAHGTHVGPSDQVVRRLIQALDDGMFHDLVRQVQTVGIFDQGPAGLTTGGVPSHDDIILEIRDNPGSSVASLDRNGFEEKVHRVREPLLGS